MIDQLDLLLAAGGDQVGIVDFGEMLMELRKVWHPFKGCGGFRLTCVGCTCNHCLNLGRSAPSIESSNTSRVGPCGFLVEYGTSGRFHYELEIAGYRDRKGC